jgi:osmotically-inducible protein OsmY
MRNSFLRVLLLSLALGVLVAAVPSCKGKIKDTDIEKAVSEKTATIGGVTATVKDGVVTLTGECKDDASKALAETTVKAIPGVKSVVNDLTVAPLPAQVPAETADRDALTKGVKEATKDFPGVTATVNDGVITVTGEISAANWKRLKISLDGLKPKKVDGSALKIK